MLQRLLEIGLNEGEAKVYLELLSIGTQLASILSKRIGLPRSTVYSNLKSLEKKGMVSFIIKKRVKFYSANDPNCLIGYIDGQCKTFDYYRNEMLSLIPKFRSIMKTYDLKKPMVSYFEGIAGVKHVMFDALTGKGDFYAYLCLHKWFHSGLKDFLLSYKDFRIFNKKVPLRAIVPDTLEVRKFFEENYSHHPKGMTQILYVNSRQNLQIFENEMNIYDNKVAILHLDRGNEYGVVIESKEIYLMQKRIFEMAWRGLGGL